MLKYADEIDYGGLPPSALSSIAQGHGSRLGSVKAAGENQMVNWERQRGPESGGQSGDMQGLSDVAEAADESVEELADTGQAFEAGVIEGVEDAGDHPEQPVRTHQDDRG